MSPTHTPTHLDFGPKKVKEGTHMAQAEQVRVAAEKAAAEKAEQELKELAKNIEIKLENELVTENISET